MKLKRTLVALLTCALVMGAMSSVVGAAVTNANTDDGAYVIDALKEIEGKDVAITDIYGVKIVLEIDATALAEKGTGGGFGFNSESTSWASNEFGNEGAEKPNTLDSNNSLTLKKDAPIFKDTDTFAQVWVQSWWGADIKVKSITLLDKDGKDVFAKDTNKEETNNEETNNEDTDTEETDNDKKTGDLDLTFVYGLILICGVGMVLTNVRKKRA